MIRYTASVRSQQFPTTLGGLFLIETCIPTIMQHCGYHLLSLYYNPFSIHYVENCRIFSVTTTLIHSEH